MRQFLCLLFTVLVSTSLFGQTSIDTSLVIQNIEVQGSRFGGLREMDGFKVLQVDYNLSSVTTTTADAFRQLPSVITDMEGAVSFRGSTGMGKLIGGVPYGLLEEYSGDVLIQLPALFFNRISLGSYPSIWRVPDGDAGVLDLSSRIYTANDGPLHVTLGAGWHERYNAGVVLNFHPGKFHINAKYDYRKEFREREFSKSTTTSKNRTDMNNKASARPDIHIADVRVVYNLSDKDELSAHGLYHLMDYDRYGRINNRVFNPKGEQKKWVIRNRYNDQRQEAYAADLSWKHQLSENQHFRLFFNYNDFIYDEGNDFKNENPQNGKIVAEDNQFINHVKRNYYWSVDYAQNWEDWKFKAGYVGRFRDEDYSTVASDKDKESGMFMQNDAKSHAYTFKRCLNMLYADIQKNFGAVAMNVGAQAEFSHNEMLEYGVKNVKDELSDHSYFHLYPRAKVMYLFNRDNYLTLSYQQRVIRPAGNYLCSFLDSSDPTRVSQGNPYLKDEFIHNLELSYQLIFPSFRLTPAVYYRNRVNRIMDVVMSQKDEVTVWKKENMGHSQTLGADLSANWNPMRFLSVGLSGDVYRDEIDGRLIGYGETKSLVCWDIKGNVNLQITPMTYFQVDGFFVSDQLTAQGELKSRYSVNLGLSQYFFKRKLCANFSVNNLFDSMEETTIIDMPGLKMIQKRNRDARVAWLTLTYSL